ncbi:hypothetical protein KKF84_02050 [Myxococcota bacterium]|nr:hypothetical protein [Myxococcota bacterium]
MKAFSLLFGISMTLVLFSCAGGQSSNNNNPSTEVHCYNGIDDDGDGDIDCDDSDCSLAIQCTIIENCSNLMDDDSDGKIDCADPECDDDPICGGTVEICNNGADDDGDGAIDCADMDCINNAACQAVSENCTNGIDDDGDGLVDCNDADCNGNANCASGVENCSNGIDDDGDSFIDCADADCASASNCNLTENCTNGVDDDGDGLIDCNDGDCTSNAACQASCSEDTLWYNSPDSCPGAEQCGMYLYNEDLYVECLPDADFAGGSFYGACGTGGECPFGSICNGDYCAPFCDVENTVPQHTCPSGGVCLYSVETINLRDIGLCKDLDNCDVTNTASCGTGLQCMLLSEGTVCLTPGAGLSLGAACQYLDDCGPGLICVGTCEQSCSNPGGTDSTHCTVSQDCLDLVDENQISLGLPYGVCN